MLPGATSPLPAGTPRVVVVGHSQRRLLGVVEWHRDDSEATEQAHRASHPGGVRQGLNPHLFRDIVATMIATEDPEHVHMILPILSHRSLKTSEKHYNHAKSLDASRRYQDVLQDFMRPVGG